MGCDAGLAAAEEEPGCRLGRHRLRLHSGETLGGVAEAVCRDGCDGARWDCGAGAGCGEEAGAGWEEETGAGSTVGDSASGEM